MCYSPLFTYKHPRLPDYALANDLFFGDIPKELQDLTVVEEAMIARRRSKSCILYLKENDDSIGPERKSTNRQRGVRGHFIVFPSYPERVSRLLPATMDDITRYICVVFVGSCRPSKDWLKQKAKPLLVRREKVRAALIWLKEHNPLYEDVVINHEFLDTLEDDFIPPVNIEVQDEFDTSYMSSGYDPIQNSILSTRNRGKERNACRRLSYQFHSMESNPDTPHRSLARM